LLHRATGDKRQVETISAVVGELQLQARCWCNGGRQRRGRGRTRGKPSGWVRWERDIQTDRDSTVQRPTDVDSLTHTVGLSPLLSYHEVAVFPRSFMTSRHAQFWTPISQTQHKHPSVTDTCRQPKQQSHHQPL